MTKDDIDKIIFNEASKCYKKYNKNGILSIDVINKIIQSSNYQELGVRKLCKIVKMKNNKLF